MNLLKYILRNGKKKDYDLSSNPKVLFDKKIIAQEITLCGHKIGNPVSELNLEIVNMTGLETYPKKVDTRIWQNEKAFVKINGEEIEFTLEERIKAVVESGGWLGYPNGSRFRIENQVIESFSLHLDMLKPYAKYSKNQIINKLGPKPKIEETYENYDGTLFQTDIINFDRNISVNWDDWDNKVLVICLGKLVDDKRTAGNTVYN